MVVIHVLITVPQCWQVWLFFFSSGCWSGYWVLGYLVLNFEKKISESKPRIKFGSQLQPDLQPETQIGPKTYFIQVLLVTNLSYTILYDIFSNWG